MREAIGEVSIVAVIITNQLDGIAPCHLALCIFREARGEAVTVMSAIEQ